MNSEFLKTWKKRVVTYRVKTCCFMVPLRTGLIYLTYLNIFVAALLILGTATETFSVQIKAVQDLLFEDSSPSLCILAPTAELAFNVVLACGIHRNDVGLLRFYLYYGLVAIVMSFLVYAIVLSQIPIIMIAGIIFSMMYQCYLLVLVRSIIVEVKLQNSKQTNGTVPTTVSMKNIDEAEKPLTVDIGETKDPSTKIDIDEVSTLTTPDNIKENIKETKRKEKDSAKKSKTKEKIVKDKTKEKKNVKKTEANVNDADKKVTADVTKGKGLGKKTKTKEKDDKSKENKEVQESETKVNIADKQVNNDNTVSKDKASETTITINTIETEAKEVPEATGVIAKFSTARPSTSWRGNITSLSTSTPRVATLANRYDSLSKPMVVSPVAPTEDSSQDQASKDTGVEINETEKDSTKTDTTEKSTVKKRGWFRK